MFALLCFFLSGAKSCERMNDRARLFYSVPPRRGGAGRSPRALLTRMISEFWNFSYLCPLCVYRCLPIHSGQRPWKPKRSLRWPVNPRTSWSTCHSLRWRARVRVPRRQAQSRAYLIAIATPGYTMMRQGPERAIAGCTRHSSTGWPPPSLRREGPGCRSPDFSRPTGLPHSGSRLCRQISLAPYLRARRRHPPG